MPTKSAIYALRVVLPLAALSAKSAVAFPQPDPPARGKYKFLPPNPCMGAWCVLPQKKSIPTLPPDPCKGPSCKRCSSVPLESDLDAMPYWRISMKTVSNRRGPVVRVPYCVGRQKLSPT